MYAFYSPMLLAWRGRGKPRPYGSRARIQYPAPAFSSLLRIDAIEQAREGDHLADVRSSANPGDGAFNPQTESGMRHAAVAPQVQIPLERFLGQIVLADALDQQIVAGNALATTDNLAVAFRREHVETQRQLGALRVRLHVERLDGCRVVMHHHRAVVLRGEHRFIIAAEIVAPLHLLAVFLQSFDRLVVSHARERRLNRGQLSGVALQGLQIR